MKMFKVVSVLFLMLFLCSNAWGTMLLGDYSFDSSYNYYDSTGYGTDFSIVDRSVLQTINSSNPWVEGTSWTGKYLGTVTGLPNDNYTGIYDYLIGRFLDNPSYSVINIDKVDADTGSTGTETSGYLTVSWIDDGKSGTWSTTPMLTNFYSIKGANEFALYYVDPAIGNGIWSTEHLLTPNSTENKPEISHISASTVAPVPEPTTMLLSGLGLISMAAYLRRRKNKKEIV